MRKLVTVRTISAIDPIPGADAIEVATVDGWKVVVKKGEYEVGQDVLYFEIDSILPKGVPEFEFLMARGCKDQPADDGTYVLGHRLRTIKLRGQVSQGLVIPMSEKVIEALREHGGPSGDEAAQFLADYFGVKKYEKPVAPSMQGVQRGSYPSWLPKTDQERVQNCFRELPTRELWRIEEKVEGSSITIYWDGEKVGVTSRNIDLMLDIESNTFVDTARNSRLLEFVEIVGRNLNQPVAIRGELVGPGIQDNIYELSDFRIYVYDVWLGSGYITPADRDQFVEGMLSYLEVTDSDSVVKQKVFAVPVVRRSSQPLEDEFENCDAIIAFADGKSLINPKTLREGLVFKTLNLPVYSFKAISNAYLMGEK